MNPNLYNDCNWGWGGSVAILDPEVDDPNYGFVQTPNVLLYIDNSNIFESAKKYSAHKKGYLSSIPDVACRIDIGKLIAKAVGNRSLLFGKLYGSEPPALDTVWEAIRRKHVYVEIFQRSKWTLKEKQTDSSLTADAVEDIILNSCKAGENRTLVLFSGDRDLMRVVDKAVKFGYQVEIWSFKSSINSAVKRKAQEPKSNLKVFNIDDIFEEITFTKVLWGKKNIPRERSLVSRVTLPPNEDKRKFLSTFVSKAGDTFKLPMMGKYLDNYKYILLVPCIKELYVPKPCQAKSASEQATVRTYDYYKHIQPFTHQLEEYFTKLGYHTTIQTFLEFLQSRGTDQKENIISPNRFRYLNIGDKDEDMDEDFESSLLSDDESEDFDCNDFFDYHHEDLSDADVDFVPFVRKESKPRRMYSDVCIHKFWCSKGLECTYKHSEKHREFFKIQPDTKLRHLYKIKPCYHATCKYADRSYLCGYAHSLEESRCLCCKQTGNGKHWMDKCPLNQAKK